MVKINNIDKIKKLLDEINNITNFTHESEEFIKWRKRVISILSRIFGDESKQAKEFKSIRFSSMIFDTSLDIVAYQDGLKRAKIQLEIIIEELEDFYIEEQEETNKKDNKKIEKIFISHASNDKEYTDLLVQLLNNIGIEKSGERIFYSSKHAYGVHLKENIYDYLKQELSKNTMVIFVLSDSYYDSVACLNEMGAAWVNSNDYYTILLPSFEFSKIEGAIDPLEISFKMNDKQRLTEFKDHIIRNFGLKDLDSRIWEEDRDKFIQEVEKLYSRDKYKNKLNRVDIANAKDKRNGTIEFDLRFINNGSSPAECQELNLILHDQNNNKLEINVPYELLNEKYIYPHENRREVFILENNNPQFKVIGYKKWETESYWSSV